VQGQSLAFESPSAFSIYLKRLINPARKADDGWKTVKYDGKFLEHYKVELARRRFAGAGPRPRQGFCRVSQKLLYSVPMLAYQLSKPLAGTEAAAARGAAVDADGGAAADGPPAAKRPRLDGNGAEEAGGSSLPGSPRGLRRSGSRAAPLPPVDAGVEAATYWNNRPRRQVRQQLQAWGRMWCSSRQGVCLCSDTTSGCGRLAEHACVLHGAPRCGRHAPLRCAVRCAITKGCALQCCRSRAGPSAQRGSRPR